MDEEATAVEAVVVTELRGCEDVVVAEEEETMALPLPPTPPPPPPPPPPPLPMPEVEPLPELTVLSEFWLPCRARLPISSVRPGAWLLLWWEDAGDGGTSPSALTEKEGLEKIPVYELQHVQILIFFFTVK